MATCFSDTALRNIHELLACGPLRKLQGEGRSTVYRLAQSGESGGILSEKGL